MIAKICSNIMSERIVSPSGNMCWLPWQNKKTESQQADRFCAFCPSWASINYIIYYIKQTSWIQATETCRIHTTLCQPEHKVHSLFHLTSGEQMLLFPHPPEVPKPHPSLLWSVTWSSRAAFQGIWWGCSRRQKPLKWAHVQEEARIYKHYYIKCQKRLSMAVRF